MDRDILLGILVLVLSYSLTLYLIFWCRRMIDRIAASKNGSLREIIKELKHGN